jgi:hypothetical protein
VPAIGAGALMGIALYAEHIPPIRTTSVPRALRLNVTYLTVWLLRRRLWLRFDLLPAAFVGLISMPLSIEISVRPS